VNDAGCRRRGRTVKKQVKVKCKAPAKKRSGIADNYGHATAGENGVAAGVPYRADIKGRPIEVEK